MRNNQKSAQASPGEWRNFPFSKWHYLKIMIKICFISLTNLISDETMQFFQIVFSLFVIAVTNNIKKFWKKIFFNIILEKVCYFKNKIKLKF